MFCFGIIINLFNMTTEEYKLCKIYKNWCPFRNKWHVIPTSLRFVMYWFVQVNAVVHLLLSIFLVSVLWIWCYHLYTDVMVFCSSILVKVSLIIYIQKITNLSAVYRIIDLKMSLFHIHIHKYNLVSTVSLSIRKISFLSSQSRYYVVYYNHIGLSVLLYYEF